MASADPLTLEALVLELLDPRPLPFWCCAACAESLGLSRDRLECLRPDLAERRGWRLAGWRLEMNLRREVFGLAFEYFSNFASSSGLFKMAWTLLKAKRRN